MGGEFIAANAINIAGTEDRMESHIPTESYIYIQMLIKIIHIQNGPTKIDDQVKGTLLKQSIIIFFTASKDLLFEEAKAKKVSKEDFEKKYTNVKNLIERLNDGVYSVIL